MTVKIIDNFLPEIQVQRLLKAWPDKNWDGWYKRSDLFQNNQYGCNNYEIIPCELKEIIDYFNSDKFIEMINTYLNIDGLKKDEHLHGAGIVQYGKDGYLDLHLDYDIHPKTGMQRKANILYYLNEEWNEEWNGDLKIYEKNKLVHEVYPKFNRLVIFSVDDYSVHGFPEKLECPDNIFRKSINVYYVTNPDYKIPKRPRAYFLPGPFDENSIPLNKKSWNEKNFTERNLYCSLK